MAFSLPFIKKPAESEVFFGLFLKETEAVGFVIGKDGEQMSIKAHEQMKLINGWDNLLDNVDEIIFSLEQKTNVHLDKVIFFVFSHFVDQHTKDIKKEYLTTFKNLLKNLELKPLGYIECYDAVVQHFEKKDQTPFTGVIIELDETRADLFIFKSGHKVYSKQVEKTGHITEDIERVLLQHHEEAMVPSRIVVYDSYGSHQDVSALVSHHWNNELFVQHPRIEIVKPEQLHQSLVDIFQGQINHDPADAPIEETTIQEEEKKEVMGFVIGKEIGDASSEMGDEGSEALGVRSEVEDNNDRTNEHHKKKFALPALSFIPMFLGGFTGGFKKMKIPMPGAGGKAIVLVPVVIVLLLLMGGIEFLFHKATVDVLFPSQTINKTLTLQGSLNGSGDVEVQTSTKSAEFSDKKSTTGKRDEGEKAKGAVNLYSYDDKDRIISKGTVVEASGVKFTLDEDVKVSSGSSSIVGVNKVTTPGKSAGKITAAALGPEGNLAKDQKFKVGDIATSTLYASNDSALTGGTKKQIKTVAKADVDALKTSILQKAKDDQSGLEVPGGQQLLTPLTETSFGKITLSKEVGEEADELTLKATIETTYYTIAISDARHFIKTAMQSDVPAGYNLDEDKITYDVKSVASKKSAVPIDLEAKGLSLKQVSHDDIVAAIKGKKQSSVETILKDSFKASGVEIKNSPPLFNIWIPFFKKNITLKVSSL